MTTLQEWSQIPCYPLPQHDHAPKSKEKKTVAEVPTKAQITEKAQNAAAKAFMYSSFAACHPNDTANILKLSKRIEAALPADLEKQMGWELKFFQATTPITKPYFSAQTAAKKALGITDPQNLDEEKKASKKSSAVSEEQQVRLSALFHKIIEALPEEIEKHHKWVSEFESISNGVIQKFLAELSAPQAPPQAPTLKKKRVRYQMVPDAD